MKASPFDLRTVAWWMVALCALGVFAGCSSATQSVRALRMHSREDARLDVVAQRLNTLERSLEQSDQLLTQTPYTPGAKWVQALPLQDAQGTLFSEQLRTQGVYVEKTLRVPTASVLSAHIGDVLQQARSAPVSGGDHTSVLDAFEKLTPQGPQLRATWNAIRTQEDAIATLDGEIRLLEDEQSTLDPKKQNPQWQKLQRQIRAKEKTRDALSDQHETLIESFTTSLDALQPTDIQADPTVLRDVLAAFSLTTRQDLESAALLPVIGVHLYRAVPFLGFSKEKHKTPENLARVAQAMELGSQYARVSSRIKRRLDASLPLTNTLSRLAATDLDQTAGFLWTTSASEEVVGFALDSFYLDLNAGAEAYWFVIADSEIKGSDDRQPSEENPVVYDFTGRRQKLNYRIDPILFASFDAKLGFDFGGIADFFKFNFDYKTDRVFKSGGSVEYNDNALEEVGLSNRAFSDALGLGLSILGVNSSVRIARFNSGEVDVEQVGTGFVTATLPLQIDLTQVDFSYNLLWVMRDTRIGAMFDALNLGFRYQNYAVPRIVYEFEDQDGNPDRDRYTYVRESPVQLIENTVYMGGASLKRGLVAGSDTGVIFDFGVFFGAGPTKYSMSVAEEAKLRQLFAVNVDFKLGWAFHFADLSERFKVDFVVVYELQGIAIDPLGGDSDDGQDESGGPGFALNPAVGQEATSGGSESDLGARNQSFGAIELFHGPKAQLKLAF